MRIPFDIKYRPQIESGEYKVETRDGKPVRIICWDKQEYAGQREEPTPIVYLLLSKGGCEHIMSCTTDGMYSDGHERDSDLFIVTPEEEELSEFEKTLVKLVKLCDVTCGSEVDLNECIKSHSIELLELAKKELEEEVPEMEFIPIENTLEYKAGFRAGRAEALKNLPRWKRSGVPHLSTEVKNYSLDGEPSDLWLLHCGWKINVKSLEKLLGFKEEDSHE